MKKILAYALSVIALSGMVGVPIFTQAASFTQEETAIEVTQQTTNADEVVKLVNQQRTKAGLKALTVDKNMTAAAQLRATEIEKKFSHTRPNGSGFSTALRDKGVSYRGAGENIAWGQKTPADVMNGWMNSSGHKANILNKSFTKIGVANYKNAAGKNYWVQLFAY